MVQIPERERTARTQTKARGSSEMANGSRSSLTGTWLRSRHATQRGVQSSLERRAWLVSVRVWGNKVKSSRSQKEPRMSADRRREWKVCPGICATDDDFITTSDIAYETKMMFGTFCSALHLDKKWLMRKKKKRLPNYERSLERSFL